MEDLSRYLPVTRQAALANGLTQDEWRRLIESDRLIRLRYGVYARQRPSEARLVHAQDAAARLVHLPQAFAVSCSALAIHQLPNPYFKSWSQLPVRLGAPRTRRATGTVKTTLAPIPSPWGPVTDLIDTAGVIASELPLPEALMVADAVARRIADTTDRFALASRSCRNGVRRQLTADWEQPAMRLANPGAESPAESFFRGHMLLAGYPEPRCGVPVKGESGSQYFADLLLDHLIIEIDGAAKYREAQDLIDEKRREDDLRAMGWQFHRVWVQQLYAEPRAQIERLGARALALPA